MHREQRNQWYIESDKGYRVAKTLSSGQAQYSSFPPHKRGEIPRSLGVYQSADEAKTACEQHANNGGENA